MAKIFRTASVALVLFLSTYRVSFSQAELAPWGNLQGIRVDGALMQFETSLNVLYPNGTRPVSTAKEKQRPHYQRSGNTQTVTTQIDSLHFTESVTDRGKGQAVMDIQMTASALQHVESVYLGLKLPAKYFSTVQISLDGGKPTSLTVEKTFKNSHHTLTSIQITSPSRHLTLRFNKPVSVFFDSTRVDSGDTRIFIPLASGDLSENHQAELNFSLKVSGTIDRSPIKLALDTAHPGRTFDGVGGNFRLQNPKVDSVVIDYCLNNMRVAWGRVEMPWALWQPQLDQDPVAAAKAGNLNPHVKASMEMAQRLSQMGIPIILTAWFPPAWAVIGQLHYKPTPEGVWGNPLDTSKTRQIYQSIAAYLLYLKSAYGVEIRDFSFNESDLGINIRQTPEAHDRLIKGLGAYLSAKGLKTKLLLGDNSDATTFSFIDAAMQDSAARPYMGAVSFHSWRGWDTKTLNKWAAAAKALKLPLIVGEGSIDAQAWGYPQIFEESSYALKEINLYVRLLAICQPESILQWQLTSDYSLLAGGGIYGNTAPLHPTQRFWNLKQLASTPKALRSLPISGQGDEVSAAALGDNKKGLYVIHLVNNGPTRKTILSGLPTAIRSLKMLVTDKTRHMKALQEIPVKNGKAVFNLNATSFTSLFAQ